MIIAAFLPDIQRITKPKSGDAKAKPQNERHKTMGVSRVIIDSRADLIKANALSDQI
ncbi:hypothetical protein PLA106_05432 [Pseudomonas amygdali pv. lachrymans str. M302278]|nr:hypothetical protein PLA106_05432 [Pseudomonas amygdali pv. lachrymans str. M302278]